MGTILCATRGGEAAVKNQQAAISRAKEKKDSLIFFYVVDVEFMAHADYALRSDVVTEEMDKMGDFLMALAVERAVKAGVEATSVLKHGNFAEQLKETAVEIKATLIVLGKPEDEASSFALAGLQGLAQSIQEETGIDVWIPGLE